MSEELELDEVLSLMDQPKQSGPRTSKKRITGEEERTIGNWFKNCSVRHDKHKPCQVKTHDAQSRPITRGVTIEIDEVAVCRECYLNERDKDAQPV